MSFHTAAERLLWEHRKLMTCFMSWLITYFPYYTYTENTPDVKVSKILGRKEIIFEKKKDE